MILHLITFLIPVTFASENQKCLDEMGQRWAVLEQKIKSGSVQTVDQSLGGETLYLNGKIDAAMATEFKRKVRALGTKVKFIVINSPGGNVGAGQEIADWIFERGPNLTVAVPYNGICASMCTHLLACAGNTSADQSALFMHHPAAMNAQGKADLERTLNKGPLANLAGDILAGLVTNSLNNNKCAKAYQSEGARRTTAATTKGLEICFSAAKVRTEYPGLIADTPATGEGLLDPPANR